jgi:acetyl-CoA hydrolase
MMRGDIDLRDHLRPGDTVVVGQGTAEPRSLVEALIEQRHDLAPLTVFVGASFTGLFQPKHADALRFIGFGGVGRTSTLVNAGVLDLLPLHLGTMPSLIETGRIAVDAVLLQLSAADAHGMHSLGLVADYLQPAIGCARVTLAEINPHVPFTLGDTLVQGDRLAAIVVDERPPLAVERRGSLPEDGRIAEFVAEIVPDGATLQFGIGGTPDAVLARLHGKRDLGVHSGLVSDAFVDLVESGAITNGRKELDTGTTIAGALFGTRRLYTWAHRNPKLAMRPLSYTHDAAVLANLRSLHAINSAIEVDLTGQINSESAAGSYVGTVGGQGAFARAAINSAHGRSIIALPSTARSGSTSRIVPRLFDGVTSSVRADVDLVVTEHGVADLRGATLAQRTKRLLAISDPRHRDELRFASDRAR